MKEEIFSFGDDFSIVLERLWKEEIITDTCENCKSKMQCYKPFLSCKTESKINEQIEKIRKCEIRFPFKKHEKTEGNTSGDFINANQALDMVKDSYGMRVTRKTLLTWLGKDKMGRKIG